MKSGIEYGYGSDSNTDIKNSKDDNKITAFTKKNSFNYFFIQMEYFDEDEFIKVKVTAQPIENKANKALIEFLSKRFKIAKTSIEILKGDTSKEKTFKRRKNLLI